jgi:hypothetical protein
VFARRKARFKGRILRSHLFRCPRDRQTERRRCEAVAAGVSRRHYTGDGPVRNPDRTVPPAVSPRTWSFARWRPPSVGRGGSVRPVSPCGGRDRSLLRCGLELT